MKKIIWVWLMMMCMSGLYSQTTVLFCAAVDPGGYCVLNNTKFITSPDSTRALIYMKVTNPKGIPSSKVIYKVFIVGPKGEETYYRSYEQSIDAGWDSSWQPDRFPTPGIYMAR